MKAITAREVVHNGKPCWRVIVPKDLSGGKQVRLFFKDDEKGTGKDKAQAKVKTLQRDRDRIGAGFHRLPQEDQALVLRALENVGGSAANLHAASEDWVKRYGTAVSGKVITDAVAECIAAKTSANLRRRYIQTLSCSLNNFAGFVKADYMHEITPAQVEGWLNGRKWKPATRKGYLTDVRTLFAFAMKRGYCPSNPAEAVEKPTLEQKPPGIHTVKEATALMAALLEHDKGLIGYVAPVYFGGLRPNEAAELSRAEVGKDLIEITPAKAKTRQRRFAAINDTLKAWLSVKGVEYGPTNLKRRLNRVRWILSGSKMKTVTDQTTGEKKIVRDIDEWAHDVLRHSFCSYGLPKFGASKVAEWAGHSESVLFAHYRERVTPDDVEEFWKLTPASLKTKSRKVSPAA